MPPRKLLLAGWDAADWKVISPLLDAGQMPNLARVVENGVIGNLATLQPVLSPMLWNSIATGKRADRHGILGFSEVDPATGAVRPVSSLSRRSKALWNILTQKGYRTNVVNWFAGHPAEPIRGISISDAFGKPVPPPDQPWPLLAGAVHPAEWAAEAAEMRVHPAEIDAGMLQVFVPRAAEIDQQKDDRLAIIAARQAESFTVQAAVTWAMRKQPWDFTAVYFPSIDHFSHSFMRYHAPRQPFVSEADFELYKDVVNSAYRLHDLMLGVLLEMAGPDTTVLVVSDHGFYSDHLRQPGVPNVPTGPTEQHRRHGIIAMMGPGIRADERIYGASLLDIAPTVLALFGLPAGDDMPGRVLAEVFDTPPALDRIPSWEDVPGECGMPRRESAMRPEDARALIEQFVALGYIERPSDDQRQAVESCVRENVWNLARVHMEARAYGEALPLLEEIHRQIPERADFALTLSDCQAALGMYDEAQASAEAAIANYRETPAADWVLANALFQRGEYTAALERLRRAEAAHPHLPALHVKIAATYAKLRRWGDARRAYQTALELDPDDADACQGLALCHLRERRFPEAAEMALRTIALEYARPWPHFYLGVALARSGQSDAAIQAFETAVRFAPAFRPAHAWLARLFSQKPDGRERYWRHLHDAREAARTRLLAEDRREQVRREARERAATRSNQAPAPAPQTTPAAAPVGTAAVDPPTEGRSLHLLLVSGLPRSGTSLMMQMLHAAGLPVMTDGERRPDQDNPEGYFEWEAVKTLRQHPEILRQAEGKVVKVISMLLPWLPNRHRYKVLFMDRPLDQVLVSHRKMLANLGREPNGDPARMRQALEMHSSAALRNVQARPNFEVLVVDYPQLVHNPDAWVYRIAEFVGSVDPARLKSAIRPDLHRQRGAAAG